MTEIRCREIDMQTFVTHADENPMLATLLTVEQLDSQRLGKQRVEAKQIYSALSTGFGWVHHPATKMWTGHLEALALYGHTVCSEWIKRGFEDTLRDWFLEHFVTDATGPGPAQWPWWVGHPKMVATHRNKLYWKNPVYYGKFFEGVQFAHYPYLWPDPLRPNVFTISNAEYRRGGFDVPPDWEIDSNTREVTFHDNARA